MNKLVLTLAFFSASAWAQQVPFQKMRKITEINNKNGISFEIYFSPEAGQGNKIRVDMSAADREVSREMRQMFNNATDNAGYVHFIRGLTSDEKVQFLEICAVKNCIGYYSK